MRHQNYWKNWNFPQKWKISIPCTILKYSFWQKLDFWPIKICQNWNLSDFEGANLSNIDFLITRICSNYNFYTFWKCKIHIFWTKSWSNSEFCHFWTKLAKCLITFVNNCTWESTISPKGLYLWFEGILKLYRLKKIIPLWKNCQLKCLEKMIYFALSSMKTHKNKILFAIQYTTKNRKRNKRIFNSIHNVFCVTLIRILLHLSFGFGLWFVFFFVMISTRVVKQCCLWPDFE